MRKVASDRKVSLEVAARDCRHEFLVRTARQVGSRRVVLAHHGNDQAELFLMRVLRGSSLEGLQGMRHMAVSPADPRIRLIRPMLDLPRERLVAEAERRELRWREDLSNRDPDALRNRIRHELLPRIRNRFQPAIVRVILRTMSILRGEAELARDGARRCAKGSDGVAWADLPAAIQRRRIVRQLWGCGVPVAFDLVERLRSNPGLVCAVAPGRSVRLEPSGRLVELERRLNEKAQFTEVELELKGRSGRVAFEDRTLCWRLVVGAGEGAWRQHGGAGREVFDADRVGRRIQLRHWRPGDRFQPIGFPARAKVQDLLVSNRIPRVARSRLLVAQGSDGEPFWIEGLRVGHRYRVTERTRRLLVWSWDDPEWLVAWAGC